MGALDRMAVASGSTTERTLIEVAGREVARRVQAHVPEGAVLAVAGRGHNGADALVALRTLKAWGRTVRAVQAGSAPPDPDVMIGWEISLEPLGSLSRAAEGAAVLLDGILGTGATGAPREPQASLIGAVNELDIVRVAVDGPSGADFSSGAVPGACVRADLTVALGWPNLGLLRYPARGYCGRIEAVEIGFPPPPDPMGARAITVPWVRETLEPRPADAHKGRAGYLTLVAGQEGMAGACLLGARAALRGGIGILKVASDPANREIIQRAAPGAIFVSWADTGAVDECVDWANALAVGPGLGRGDDRRRLVERVLRSRSDRPAVVDADGLNAFEGDLEGLAGLVGPLDVITPHPGELARLTGRDQAEVVADPIGVARYAASRLGCVVLLKGAPSLVVGDGGPVRISTTGGPAVASGGTGDVLTGLIGAYLAVGMRPADAAAAALFVTGVAAGRSPEPAGHLASDLPDRIPEVRAEMMRPGASAGPLIFASDA
jgi:NAD(P)H-hydrate epimerase